MCVHRMHACSKCRTDGGDGGGGVGRSSRVESGGVLTDARGRGGRTDVVRCGRHSPVAVVITVVVVVGRTYDTVSFHV